ncbi:MAG: ATP-binding cassette domain-containing protein, partial [Clostridia bacterium]|nr:ATP-binding cassette domain-containing protein [Clostridia bacterium]
QQMVEIAKSLIYKKDIIIMDEPTSSISEKDTKELFNIINNLKKQGVSIIYISHRLQELSQIADRITVLRDGKKTGTVNINDVSIDTLISMMVGRTLQDVKRPRFVQHAQTVLEVKNISRGKKVRNVSFDLKKGEILGFAGLVGSGRTELMRMLFGADRPDNGEIAVKGVRLINNSTVKAVKSGIAYLSEDRKLEGLVLGMPVSQMFVLS